MSSPWTSWRSWTSPTLTYHILVTVPHNPNKKNTPAAYIPTMKHWQAIWPNNSYQNIHKHISSSTTTKPHVRSRSCWNMLKFTSARFVIGFCSVTPWDPLTLAKHSATTHTHTNHTLRNTWEDLTSKAEILPPGVLEMSSSWTSWRSWTSPLTYHILVTFPHNPNKKNEYACCLPKAMTSIWTWPLCQHDVPKIHYG